MWYDVPNTVITYITSRVDLSVYWLFYGMNDRGSIPGIGRIYFSSPRVQTGSGDHSASYKMGTRSSFLGGKAAAGRSWPLTLKVKLSLCLTKHHAMKMYWDGGIVPLIFDLGTTRRWVFSFTPWPLYPRGKSPRYVSDRRRGWHQSRSEGGGEEKRLPARTGNWTPVEQPV